MNKTSRRISMLLVLTMVLGLLAAFPAMNVFAADTNYALGVVPTIFTDEAGTTAATPYGTYTAATSIITDGTYETTEILSYAGGSNTYWVNFDLGSVKTDLSSVYLYMRNVGNRAYPAVVKVYVSSDNATYTEVSTISELDTTTTANYAYGNYKFTSVQSGRYVRLALTAGNYITSFAEIEIRNYGLAAAGESQTTADPTLVEGNYAYGATYTVTKNDGDPTYRTNMPDSGNMLTDGYEGANPTNNGTVGYTVAYTGTDAVYVFTLALTAAKSDIGYVTFVNVPAPGESFKDPASVSISTSADGLTYTTVGSVLSGATPKNGGGANDLTYTFAAASGQYVQITVNMGGYMLGLDEIVVGSASNAPSLDTDPSISCDSTVVTSTTETNYALASNGAYYAYGTYFPSNTSYADDTWTRAADVLNKFGQGQLNDGAVATDSYSDTAWVGFVLSTTSNVDIIFDLAHLYGDIDQIAFTTLAHGNDVTQYEKVEKITVSFGDINGTYGAATEVVGLVTEESYTSATNLSVTRYTSQFAVDGPATGARYVKISIPKATYRLFIDEIKVLGASGFDYSADPSSEEPTTDPTTDPSSGDSSENSYEAERGSFDPDASYVIAPEFRTELSAEYGEFDTNGDGTVDFTGIALTVSLVDITYQYGIWGLEGYINFDNTYLTPLWVSDADLNGDGTLTGVLPKPVLTWPTVDTVVMGNTYSLKCVEGMSQTYSMADGSATNPNKPEQEFSKTYSRLNMFYIMHTDYFDGYNPNDTDDNGNAINHDGAKADNEMQLRYYFTVAEGQEGQTFTFQVPDSPDATHIANTKLNAPSYDPTTMTKGTTLAGKGGEASVTIPAAPVEYTVTFVGMDGTTLKTETVLEGGAATAPEAPVVDGYTFTGWDVAFDNVTSDLTVTAQYEVAEVAEFFVFAEGADVTYISIDEANAYLIFKAGGLTVANVKALFVDANITLATATGGNKTTGRAGTGCTITSTIGNQSKTLTIVVKGDIDGNGSIMSSDYSKLTASVTSGVALEGCYKVAADVQTPVNTVNTRDVSKLSAYISGTATNF